MDSSLAGHAYVKAPIDVACWDILGKMVELPLCSLFGGRFGSKVPVYRSVCEETLEENVESVKQCLEEGYTKFQLKVGRDDLEYDIEIIKAVASLLRKGKVLRTLK